jgi:hypothetical protein
MQAFGKLMPFKKKLTYVVGILFALVFLSGINIAMPTTIKVKDAETGKPASGAHVVTYLAIRGGFHNFDDGQSLSQGAITNDQGEAHFGLDFTWVFLNRFQDYNSRIVVYKPQHAPHIAMDAFDIHSALVTYAEPKNLEFTLNLYSLNPNKKNNEMTSLQSQFGYMCTKKEVCRKFKEAFYIEYYEFARNYLPSN